VGLLWRRGECDAAIRLEEHWNRLAQHRKFVLYCAYLRRPVYEETFENPLEDLGRVHGEEP